MKLINNLVLLQIVVLILPATEYHIVVQYVVITIMAFHMQYVMVVQTLICMALTLPRIRTNEHLQVLLSIVSSHDWMQ